MAMPSETPSAAKLPRKVRKISTRLLRSSIGCRPSKWMGCPIADEGDRNRSCTSITETSLHDCVHSPTGEAGLQVESRGLRRHDDLYDAQCAMGASVVPSQPGNRGRPSGRTGEGGRRQVFHNTRTFYRLTSIQTIMFAALSPRNLTP